MTFTLHVEHEIVGGKTVLEKFEGVETFNDPPMTDILHLGYPGDTGEERLNYGNVVKAVNENE